MAVKKQAPQKKTAKKTTKKTPAKKPASSTTAPGTPPQKALWSPQKRSAATAKLTAALSSDPALRQKWLKNRAAVLKQYGVSADDVSALAAVLHPEQPILKMPWPPSSQPQIVVATANPWQLKANQPATLDVTGQGFQPGDGVALVSSDNSTKVEATAVSVGANGRTLTATVLPTKKGWYSLIVANKATERWGGLMNAIQVT